MEFKKKYREIKRVLGLCYSLGSRGSANEYYEYRRIMGLNEKRFFFCVRILGIFWRDSLGRVEFYSGII